MTELSPTARPCSSPRTAAPRSSRRSASSCYSCSRDYSWGLQLVSHVLCTGQPPDRGLHPRAGRSLRQRPGERAHVRAMLSTPPPTLVVYSCADVNVCQPLWCKVVPMSMLPNHCGIVVHVLFIGEFRLDAGPMSILFGSCVLGKTIALPHSLCAQPFDLGTKPGDVCDKNRSCNQRDCRRVRGAGGHGRVPRRAEDLLESGGPGAPHASSLITLASLPITLMHHYASNTSLCVCRCRRRRGRRRQARVGSRPSQLGSGSGAVAVARVAGGRRRCDRVVPGPVLL